MASYDTGGKRAHVVDHGPFVHLSPGSGSRCDAGRIRDGAGGRPGLYADVHAAYSIQGTGPSAAITGTVTTQGVVVGDFETGIGLQGFYLQDASGDGNPATSDGIFVFTGTGNTVSAGQLVRVTGFARERFGQTALDGSDSNSAAVPAGNIVNCRTGATTPTTVTMPFASPTSPEAFQGMSVRLPQALVISEYFNYDRFGELVLALPLPGEARLFTPTLLVEPAAPAQARAAAYNLRRITLDDGLGVQNPASRVIRTAILSR